MSGDDANDTNTSRIPSGSAVAYSRFSWLELAEESESRTWLDADWAWQVDDESSLADPGDDEPDVEPDVADPGLADPDVADPEA